MDLKQEETSVEDRAYLSHLGSIGIQGVKTEGEHIKSEKDSVAVRTRSLAFDHYRTFIATADCGKDAAVHLEASQEHVEELTEKLPPLRQSCLDFETQAKDLVAKRKNTSLVLARHTRLLEILELPQLVDNCVRNGHYDEALELQQYATRVEKKLGNIPIVVEVVKAVKQTSKKMLNELLSQLRASIQLPACLKVVGYLRRMDAFGETELRLRFLQARDSWFTSILKKVPKDNPYDHLSKTLELTRVHLFDIVTQYRALFSDDDPLAFGASANLTTHRVMFSTWLDSKISQFLKTLKDDLDQGAKRQALDSILSQAMYFGQSLGRVGADFRPALVPILSQAALDVSLEHLQDADQKFKSGIDLMALKALVKNDGKDDQDQDPFQPPSILLEFTPLAELCNAILSSLNEIRLCAPISIAPKIIERIQEVLVSAAQTLQERERRFGKSSIETEKATFQQLVVIFNQTFLPYIDRCLKRIFPLDEQTISLNFAPIQDALPMKDIILASQAPPPTQNLNEVSYVIDRVSVISQELDQVQ